MVSQAPVEIWTQILEEVIDVPEFFSGDPLEPYRAESWIRFRHEAHYWRSERWRSICRRVHSSWNAILSQDIYRHRFVNMNDIKEGRLSPTNVPWRMVLRLDLRPSGIPATPLMKALERDVSEGDSAIQWRLRIVDGLEPIGSKFQELLGRLASIRAISSRQWSTIFEHRKSLRLFVHAEAATSSFPLTRPSCPNLTSLTLSTYAEPASIQDWDLPSLAHLQISYWPSDSSPGSFVTQLVRTLEALGKNLRTLHINYTRMSEILPQLVWHLAPKLTRIHLNCFWTHPPPPNHPLSMIHISSGVIASYLTEEDYKRMPGWPAIERLAQFSSEDYHEDAEAWRMRNMHVSTANLWEYVLYGNHRDHPWVVMSDMYERIGWTVTDSSGLTLSAFLVLLLKDRRNAKQCRTPDWEPLGWRYYKSGGWAVQDVGKVTEETDRRLLWLAGRKFEPF